MTINRVFRLFLTIIVIFTFFGCGASFGELAHRKDWPEFQRLIAKGVDVNARDKYGNPALMYAAGYGKTEIVQTLIDKGADINAKNNGGQTSLMWASSSVILTKGADVEVVQLLLAKGANVNATDEDGSTALIIASKNGKTEIVQALIDKGADVNAERIGPGALIITSGGQIGGVTKGRRETALSLAIEKQHKDIVNILRAHGAKE